MWWFTKPQNLPLQDRANSKIVSIILKALPPGYIWVIIPFMAIQWLHNPSCTRPETKTTTVNGCEIHVARPFRNPGIGRFPNVNANKGSGLISVVRSGCGNPQHWVATPSVQLVPRVAFVHIRIPRDLCSSLDSSMRGCHVRIGRLCLLLRLVGLVLAVLPGPFVFLAFFLQFC